MQRYQRAGDLFRALFLASPREVAQVRERLGVSPARKPGPGSTLQVLAEDGSGLFTAIPDAHLSHPEPSAFHK